MSREEFFGEVMGELPPSTLFVDTSNFIRTTGSFEDFHFNNTIHMAEFADRCIVWAIKNGYCIQARYDYQYSNEPPMSFVRVTCSMSAKPYFSGELNEVSTRNLYKSVIKIAYKLYKMTRKYK